MKIFRIFSSAVERRASRKAVETIEQREARIAKNFSMKTSLNTGEGEAYGQIYPMRAAIANYAKEHGVKVDITEDYWISNPDLQIEVKTLDDDIFNSHYTRPTVIELVVTNLDKENPKSLNSTLSGHINKIFYTETNKKLPPKVGNYDVNSEIQDNFLRHVFRTIEKMTDKLAQK